MSGQSKKATRWKRNRKFGDVYGGRTRPKLSENIFSRCHSLARPSENDPLPVLIEDNPSRDYFFPLSVEQCWEAVQALPKRDTEGLTHIWCRRLSGRQVRSGEYPFAEFICGSGVRVVVLYPWPRSMKMRHGSEKLSNQFLNELKKFGAVVEFEDGQWISKWGPSGLRKFYIEALIYHEVGHHVDWYRRHWSSANHRAIESAADEYAMQRTATAVHVLNRIEKTIEA